MTVRTRPHSRSTDPITVDGMRRVYGALGYRSVRVAAAEGRSYTAYPGESHDERDRAKLVNQSRDFMRNNAIYKGMIERMVSYIVGNGFELQVTGAADGTIKKVEGLWRSWFAKPEVRNLLSGAEVSRMICRELLIAGDNAVLKTDKGLIQLFEAEQIDSTDTKKFPNGIRKDDYGRPMEFSLCPWQAHGLDKRKANAVKAEDVLFLTNPERPSNIRGVPASQSSFAMLHRINDVCDSEAIAWQLLSRMAIAITRESGEEKAYIESKDDPDKTTEDKEGDLATRLTELDYALIFHGKTGEGVAGIERNIPGMNFSESLRMFLRLLGLPVGCPLELVLLDWTKSNYSQSRAVLEQAFENFLFWQYKLRDFFYGPLFEWKLGHWQSQDTGGIGKNNKLAANWIMPTFPWIDQLKEVQAYSEKVERGFTTHSQTCKSLKLDPDDVLEQREAEVRSAIERAQRIEKETGVLVPWQHFAGLKPPTQAPAVAEEKPQTDKQEPDEDEDEDA